jgi:hypothetical protein
LKTQERLLVVVGAALLLLLLSLVFQRQSIEVPVPQIPPASVEPASPAGSRSNSSRFFDAQAVGPSESNEDAALNNEMRAARGSGYLWGKALNGVYAPATSGADRPQRLDLTQLERSFKGFVRPVNLEDHTASRQARAEYLSAVITSALDLNTAEQPILAELLQEYYAADSRAGTPQDNERTKLSSEAREALLARLPRDAGELFQTVFNTPDFLFRSMFVTADELTLAKGGGTVLATGGATFTIGRDGALLFDANSVSVENSGAKLRNSEP